MEMITDNNSKGFVYTLEAIIASSLFLVMVLAVIPSFQDSTPPEQARDTAQSTLESLDKGVELRDNLSVAGIEEELDPYLPSGYGHKVRIESADTETRIFDSPGGSAEFYFDKKGNHTSLQLWIREADGLNVTYRGEKIVKNQDSEEYIEDSLTGPAGFLNFTGTGSGRFDFKVHSSKGEIPEKENMRSMNYVVHEENITEVRVFLWQKEQE